MPIRGPGSGIMVQTPVDSPMATVPLELTVKKWFTSIETVKKMYTAMSRSLFIQNDEEILVGYFQSELDFGNIIENSERIKVLKRALSPDEIQFENGEYYALSNDDIIKGSVVVTDLDEKIEWTEGVDFEIDYTSGKIRRILITENIGDASSSGVGSRSALEHVPLTLTIKQKAKIHYQYYDIKIKDHDYSINYERGTISRKEGGTIVSGEKIYADYKVNELVKDDIVALSIDQAHTWIINRIGIEYESIPDDSLKYAEAYYALYLISKMSAANMIYEKRNDDVEEAAKELKLISNDFRDQSIDYLKDYFKIPTGVKGAKKVKNVSWILKK